LSWTYSPIMIHYYMEREWLSLLFPSLGDSNMANISYNKTLCNYIVTFADGSTISCRNYQTALFYKTRGY